MAGSTKALVMALASRLVSAMLLVEIAELARASPAPAPAQAPAPTVAQAQAPAISPASPAPTVAPPAPARSVAPAERAVASAADRAPTLASLVGDARCDSDAQCHTVAVGRQACGGPSAFVAWSERRSDSTAIAAAADATRSIQAPRGEGRFSTCGVVRDPGAYCASNPEIANTTNGGRSGGVCRLRRSRGAASPSLPDR